MKRCPLPRRALISSALPIRPWKQPDILEPVSPKDRPVVATAVATHADAIVTFNLADFAAAHLKEHLQIEVIHPDDFVMDLVDLNASALELSMAKRGEYLSLTVRIHGDIGARHVLVGFDFPAEATTADRSARDIIFEILPGIQSLRQASLGTAALWTVDRPQWRSFERPHRVDRRLPVTFGQSIPINRRRRS
jgi:hypothetical protein